MRQQVEEAIREERIVAILRGVPVRFAAAMGEALLAGGIRVMEVALSDSAAPQALAALARAVGDRGYVGAGTVTSREMGELALGAGACFFVTPHVVPEVGRLAQARNVAVLCGALTPTEISAVRQLGSHIVKLFPASAMGPGYIKALKGPYPDLEVLAVGGIGPSNLAAYLEAGALGAGVGGALTDLDWSSPDFVQVTRQARALVATVQDSR